jgi:hypothetical protein
MFTGPNTITNGLVLSLDAANIKSYVNGSTTWRDLSGNRNNGTLTNGPTFNSANLGSIAFDGVDDYANLSTIFNFTSEPFTFSYWINFNSLTTNQAGQGPIVIYKGSFQNNGYYDQINTAGGIGFVTNQSAAFQATSTNTGIITTATWYNISYARSGSSIRIYINGVDSTSTAGTHTNPTNSTNEFRLANYQNGFIYGNFKLASFLTYNRALSSTEIFQNYEGQKSRYNPE